MPEAVEEGIGRSLVTALFKDVPKMVDASKALECAAATVNRQPLEENRADVEIVDHRLCRSYPRAPDGMPDARSVCLAVRLRRKLIVVGRPRDERCRVQPRGEQPLGVQHDTAVYC